jgi:hypothetical protein
MFSFDLFWDISYPNVIVCCKLICTYLIKENDVRKPYCIAESPFLVGKKICPLKHTDISLYNFKIIALFINHKHEP